MDKTKPDATLSGPIAKKVVAKVSGIWDAGSSTSRGPGRPRYGGRITEDDCHQKDLASLDPAHAAYVYTQNQVSVMSEQLTGLKEMAPFAT